MPVNNPSPQASPAGKIAPFAGVATPAGWLLCNGAAVSRTTHAALFAVIGTTYGVGDGATTFNVPDLRGEFLQGADLGRGIDPGRLVGSAQGDSLPDHAHQWFDEGVGGAFTIDMTGWSATATWDAAGNPVANTGDPLSGDKYTSPALNAKSGAVKPRSVAVLYIIKS